MKTVSLLRLLNDKEKLALLNQLKQEKKPRLQKALSLYMKVSEPTKEELYKAIFSEKYTVAKDANLRNELRFLNEEIEDVLISRALEGNKNPYYKQRILLDVFFVYKADELFLSKYNEAMEEQKTYPYAKRLEDMLELKVRWHARKYGFSGTKAIELWDEIMSYKKRIENYALQIEYSYNEILNALSTNLTNEKVGKFLQKKIAKLTPAKHTIYSTKPIQELEPMTISKYYSTLSLDFQSTVDDKIRYIEESIENLERYPEFIFGRYDKLAFYYLSKNDITSYCKNSEIAYQLFLSIKHLPDAIKHYTTVKNYIIACVLMGKAKEALTVYDIHKNKMNEYLYKSNELVLYLVSAYILEEDFDTANALLPANFSKYSPQEVYFARALFVITNIELRHYELSATEIDNAIRALKTTSLDDDFKNIFKGLKCYLNTKLGKQNYTSSKILMYLEGKHLYPITIKKLVGHLLKIEE